VGPLGHEAVAEMVRDRFSGASDQDLVTTCVEATGGNPFLLQEVIDALIVDHVAPDEAALLVGNLGPETVARSVMLRLARLPVAAGPVANAVAVLDGRAEVHYVAALCELSTNEVDEAADALTAVSMLDDGRPLRFVHPIVRHAVYQQMTPASRSRLHAKAAFILMSEHEPPERVATHTFFFEPAGDQRVVQMLRDAAAVSLSHRAGDKAQRFLERALAEPPSSEALVDVLAELGTAEAVTGRDLVRANEHLEQAAAGTDDLGLRTERVRRSAHARLYMGDFAGAAELLGRERAVVSDGERSTALRLLADEAGIGVLVPPIGAAAVAELEQYTNLAGESAAELAVLAELAGKRWLQGWINEAAEFALRAMSGGALLVADGPGSVAFNHAVAVLVDGDRFDEVEGPLEAAVGLARDQGSLIALVGMTGLQAIVAWRKGVLAEVEALSRAVLDLSEASGTSLPNPNYLAYLGAALVERGELTEAEAVIGRIGVGPDMPNSTYGGMPFFARARLRLAQNRHVEALEDLLEVRSREHAMGVRHMRIPWRREAVEAALVLDDVGLAGDLATEQLELTERWDISSARGIALCTEGLARRGDRGIELLEEGSALLDASPARLDLARALLDLGVALRVEGRRAEARGPLRSAVDIARSCGATTLATRAHEELIAAGARPRRLQFSGLESLTASQRRVAVLAARGESNRAIAAALFVTVRTVENHLAAAYLKLGISSRGELGQALGNDRD
jgi:DNA-binding CsgD family transcriptional regulator